MTMNENSQPIRGIDRHRNQATDSVPKTISDCIAWNRTNRLRGSAMSTARAEIQPRTYESAAATLASQPSAVRSVFSGMQRRSRGLEETARFVVQEHPE